MYYVSFPRWMQMFFWFQIDNTTIPLIDEEDLAKYLPKKGDRVAVRSYCTNGGEGKKSKPIEQICMKYFSKDKAQYGTGNVNAAKKSRTIEIGWLNYEETNGIFKQVRMRSGGGTRKITADKNSSKDDIIGLALSLFFPNGISKKGEVDDFEHALCDFKETEIKDGTLAELYESSRMRPLRVYLRTKRKKVSDVSSDDENLLKCTKPKRRKKTNSTTQDPSPKRADTQPEDKSENQTNNEVNQTASTHSSQNMMPVESALCQKSTHTDGFEEIHSPSTSTATNAEYSKTLLEDVEDTQM